MALYSGPLGRPDGTNGEACVRVYIRCGNASGGSHSIVYDYVALHSRAPLGEYGRLGQWCCSYSTHGMEPIQCISVSQYLFTSLDPDALCVIDATRTKPNTALPHSPSSNRA